MDVSVTIIKENLCTVFRIDEILRGLNNESAGGNEKTEKALAGVMELVLEDRRKARAEKNWAESDRIRDLLAQYGITVKDGKEGTTWNLE